MIETRIAGPSGKGDSPGRRATNAGRANTGRRAKQRDSLFLLATVRRLAEPDVELTPVRVRNLSSVGLMVDHHAIAEPGEPVIVEVRGIGAVPGKVAWARRGRVGILFDSEVDPKLARKPVGPASDPKPKR